MLQNLRSRTEPAEIGESRSAYAFVGIWVSRGVESAIGLAVLLQAIGAEVRACELPDRAEQLAE
ncbi:hypothetical protein [Streptomyces sp. NBC_00258]|uniref:hypothetical protein n=1 Tax=Streptomyces sp. NBC_00258 TaxID=2903642 RepID=UPI002E2A074B|nr:hypothetical protein [Streptomyces sp. NBC_00258]